MSQCISKNYIYNFNKNNNIFGDDIKILLEQQI